MEHIWGMAEESGGVGGSSNGGAAGHGSGGWKADRRGGGSLSDRWADAVGCHGGVTGSALGSVAGEAGRGLVPPDAGCAAGDCSRSELVDALWSEADDMDGCGEALVALAAGAFAGQHALARLGSPAPIGFTWDQSSVGLMSLFPSFVDGNVHSGKVGPLLRSGLVGNGQSGGLIDLLRGKSPLPGCRTVGCRAVWDQSPLGDEGDRLRSAVAAAALQGATHMVVLIGWEGLLVALAAPSNQRDGLADLVEGDATDRWSVLQISLGAQVVTAGTTWEVVPRMDVSPRTQGVQAIGGAVGCLPGVCVYAPVVIRLMVIGIADCTQCVCAYAPFGEFAPTGDPRSWYGAAPPIDLCWGVWMLEGDGDASPRPD